MKGLVFSTVTGGLINGGGSVIKGKNFFDGGGPLVAQPNVAPQVSNAATTKQTGGNHSVYEGKNPATGKVEHVGRSIQPETRFKRHHNKFKNQPKLDYNVVKDELNLIDARILEQNLMNQYGLPNLHRNYINLVAPKYWDGLGIKKKLL